jgi:shikimate 5-dehydrogenase
MTLRTLFEDGMVTLALLPERNDYLLSESGKRWRASVRGQHLGAETILPYLDLSSIDRLDGYTVPLIAHDYGAKTPLLWNTLYEQLDLRVRNIMVVADPTFADDILTDLLDDPKYLGGGAGVGFKEAVLRIVTPVPSDLQSVNIIVKRDGGLYGYNTDALGFVRSLEEELSAARKKIAGSHFVLYGAGGVAKEVGRLLGRKNAASLGIINRTVQKAVTLAHTLNHEFPGMTSYGAGEHLSRGVLLNSGVHPDALINTTDKGSDRYADTAFYTAPGPDNEELSRVLLRYLFQLRPDTVIADIVLPSKGPSLSLRLARAEGFTHLIDGVPMVVNQAAPAYVTVQDAHLSVHPRRVSEDEALVVFRDAVKR